MKKLLIVIIMVIAGLGISQAQQIPQFRHSVFSRFYTNPAYAFDPYKPDILLNHRSQWVGFEGSPTTSSLSGTYPFREDMAAGLTISNDAIGAMNNLLFNISYAYQLKLNHEWHLNFGIAWTIMQARLDGSGLDLFHDDDELVTENMTGKSWKPDANAGIMVQNGTFYAGISAMQLFESKYRLYGENQGSIKANRHYFVTGGGHFEAGRNAMVHASVLGEYVSGSPLRIDATGMLEYNNAMLAGMSYSLGDAISVNAGYKYTNFYIMYSYDIVINRMMSACSGAHEITLGYFLDTDNQGGSNYKPMF